MNTYASPISKLLSYGEAHLRTDWPNYVAELSLSPSHISELIRLATDTELGAVSALSQEIWAPVHAWRALGQLGATASVMPLLRLLEDTTDDWANEELPIVIGMIGPSAYFTALAEVAEPQVYAQSVVKVVTAHVDYERDIHFKTAMKMAKSSQRKALKALI